MVSEIKTLEQIQEEFRKKIGEIGAEEIKKENINQSPLRTSTAETVNKDTKEDIPSETTEVVLQDQTEEFFEAEKQEIMQKILRNHKHRKIRSAVKWISGIIITLCVVGIVLGGTMFLMGKKSDKTFFGYGFYPVKSDEMSPAYNPGDMVIYKDMDIEDIEDTVKEGSVIITYTDNERKDLCIAQVEMLIRDNRTGDVYYKIKGDKDTVPNDTVHIRLVKGNVKKHPLKWFAYGVDFVVNHIGYLALFLGATFVVCLIIRGVCLGVFRVETLYNGKDLFDEEEDKSNNNIEKSEG